MNTSTNLNNQRIKNMFECVLKWILVILIIFTIIQIFMQTTYYHDLLNIIGLLCRHEYIIPQPNTKGTTNLDADKLHNTIIDLTQHRINLVAEKSYTKALEQFTNLNISDADNSSNSSINKKSTSVKSLNSTGFLSKTSKTTLLLFYKPTCKYSVNFLPTWYKILNNLPTNILYQEIDCSKDISTPAQYNITGVPTLVLEFNTQTFTYVGNREYDDIKRFLRENGVNLVERSFDAFSNLDTMTSGMTSQMTAEIPEPTNKLSKNCPLVSFDKDIDLKKDSYQFQVFNENGQYGYAEGGNNGKLLSPYMAAYSVVDSYLSSLPDITNPEKNTFKHVDECAQAYVNDINCFGLCDKAKLDEIANYQNDINNGAKVARINGIDYSSNPKVVNAIKKACQM